MNQYRRLLIDAVPYRSHGVTGQAILRAVVHGERDSLTLAQLRHPACKAQIERQVAVMTPRVESGAPLGPLPRVTPGSTSKHPPRDDVRAHLVRLTGVDVVAVTGIVAAYARKRRERALKHRTCRANTLGDTLIPVAASPPVPVAYSCVQPGFSATAR
ncbi:MAG: hypothetical protein ACRERE_39425 [Candidatus Entotheonellia bacterium]